MSNSRHARVAVASLFGLALTIPAAAETTYQRQQALHFEKRIEKTLAAPYLLYFPESYGKDEQRWPLLVHLHGGGGVGTDVARLPHYPLVRRLEKEPDFPFVVVTPQCPPGVATGHGPLGNTWTEHGELVDALIDSLLETYQLDPDRVVLVGHSMGGYGAWYLAHRYPSASLPWHPWPRRASPGAPDPTDVPMALATSLAPTPQVM